MPRKKTYPELVGKEVVMVDPFNMKKGIVVYCHYDYGITIVDKNGDEISCLNKKYIENCKSRYKVRYRYKKTFYNTIRQIKKGIVATEENDKILNPHYTGMATNFMICPFK